MEDNKPLDKAVGAAIAEAEGNSWGPAPFIW